ncbi:ASCH domain-containing protein [Vulcanibacillus modesticaldus]|uniref:ASCH domain-containing protein n=1 Tax=Vulcanibacillus modesticaldus TaxID=337097 RepID=UPI000A00EFA7
MPILDGEEPKKKTGTSSSLWSYEYFHEEIPKKGEISIITNWAGRPKCVIETTKVEIVKFNKVTEEFAKTEGEGVNLEYWRKVHWDFFQKESRITGKLPDENMPIVCENFKVIYEFKE